MTTARLTRQLDRVAHVMRSGDWLSLGSIAETTRDVFDALDSEPAISARLRDLRKHGWAVERKRSRPGSNLWIYRATPPVKAGEQLTFGGIR